MRPRSPLPLDHVISIRLQDHESREFEKIAQRFQVTPARLMRKMIRDSIGAGPDLLPQDAKLVEEAIYQLSMLGRNLNQLLRAIHQGKVSATTEAEVGIAELRDKVVQLKDGMQDVYDRSRYRLVPQNA